MGLVNDHVHANIEEHAHAKEHDVEVNRISAATSSWSKQVTRASISLTAAWSVVVVVAPCPPLFISVLCFLS